MGYKPYCMQTRKTCRIPAQKAPCIDCGRPCLVEHEIWTPDEDDEPAQYTGHFGHFPGTQPNMFGAGGGGMGMGGMAGGIGSHIQARLAAGLGGFGGMTGASPSPSPFGMGGAGASPYGVSPYAAAPFGASPFGVPNAYAGMGGLAAMSPYQQGPFQQMAANSYTQTAALPAATASPYAATASTAGHPYDSIGALPGVPWNPGPMARYEAFVAFQKEKDAQKSAADEDRKAARRAPPLANLPNKPFHWDELDENSRREWYDKHDWIMYGGPLTTPRGMR